MHRNSKLKKSNKMQRYADIYLLLNYSTCFGRPSRPSSGVHKTVVAASGTDPTVWGAGFLKRDQIRTSLGPYRDQIRASLGPYRDQIRTSLGPYRDQIRTGLGPYRDQIRTSLGPYDPKPVLIWSRLRKPAPQSRGCNYTFMYSDDGRDERPKHVQ